MNKAQMDFQSIEDYGIIGDLDTVALIGMDGSIDFMCFPYFDSPTIFAAILDPDKGGRFRIAPVLPEARHKQLYLPDTNVLLTRFLGVKGVAEISDFMPIHEVGKPQAVVRSIKTIRGEIEYEMVCDPQFDYARADRQVEQKEGQVLFSSRGQDGTVLRLRTSVPVDIVNGAAAARFKLKTGDSATFVLEDARMGSDTPSAAPDYVAESFNKTINFWKNWITRVNYAGRWQESVHRSALVLKLLTSKTYGSIVAAPTFGLPEELGGERNWDYRYTWIRDASFTLYAYIQLGLQDEARAFFDWIGERCHEVNPDGSFQIMYGIDGRKNLTEIPLAHLCGHKHSTPVRIGNGAYNQFQLDIYGELLNAVYLYDNFCEPIGHESWMEVSRIVNWVCEHWQQKDEGIWEVRGGQQEFLHSRLMCWVAVDRAIRMAASHSRPAPFARWDKTRTEIYWDIFNNFWDLQLGAFVQHKGSKTLDAACLMMPLLNFVSGTDRHWLSTLRAVERELVDDSLVYRYNTETAASDGLRGEEGTFSICSFWYIECLSRAGELDKARFLLDKALGYANHLGLYAEELGPRGEHLGNFPQAFSHLAFIGAAYDLNRRLELE